MERARATWEYGQRPVTLLPVFRQPEVVLWRANGAILTDMQYRSQIGMPRGQIYGLYKRRDFTSCFAANVASASGAAYIRRKILKLLTFKHG